MRQERESPLDWSRNRGQLLLLSAPTEHMEVSGVESAGTRKWLSMSFWLLPSKIGAEPKRLDLKFNFKEKKNFGPAFRTTFIELKLKKKEKKKKEEKITDEGLQMNWYLFSIVILNQKMVSFVGRR